MASPDPVKGIGISWLWMLPDSHPFYLAALYHDQQYDLRFQGLIADESSARADREFYRLCKIAAGNSIKLQAQARLFYCIVRTWGSLRWPVPSSIAPEVYPVYAPVLPGAAMISRPLVGWSSGCGSPWIRTGFVAA